MQIVDGASSRLRRADHHERRTRVVDVRFPARELTVQRAAQSRFASSSMRSSRAAVGEPIQVCERDLRGYVWIVFADVVIKSRRPCSCSTFIPIRGWSTGEPCGFPADADLATEAARFLGCELGPPPPGMCSCTSSAGRRFARCLIPTSIVRSMTSEAGSIAIIPSLSLMRRGEGGTRFTGDAYPALTARRY